MILKMLFETARATSQAIKAFHQNYAWPRVMGDRIAEDAGKSHEEIEEGIPCLIDDLC